jgi:hypothetical protein
MRLILLAVGLLGAVACRHRPAVVQVPVQYLGHDVAVRAPSKFSSKRIFLVVENRFGESDQIGQDASAGIPILADPGEVTRLVDSGFRQELGQMGAHLAAAPDGAEVILKVGVTVVNVDEGGKYGARIVAEFEVSEPSGRVLASSTLEGGDSHVGEDYSGGEVNVTLNKALADLIARVFTDRPLMATLSSGVGPAR